MKLSKLIRELSVARDKIKVDPEIGVYSKQSEFSLKFQGYVELVICKENNKDQVLLVSKLSNLGAEL